MTEAYTNLVGEFKWYFPPTLSLSHTHPPYIYIYILDIITKISSVRYSGEVPIFHNSFNCWYSKKFESKKGTIIYSLQFFTLALANVFLLEFEWQQVSSSL